MATNRMENIHPLKAYRERQDPPLTQDQLADLLGVSKAVVSRWEAGERQPGVGIIPTITEKTGISARELRPDLAGLMADPPIKVA
jgi:transcriptional regulator with XRE-family HTH domain